MLVPILPSAGAVIASALGSDRGQTGVRPGSDPEWHADVPVRSTHRESDLRFPTLTAAHGTLPDSKMRRARTLVACLLLAAAPHVAVASGHGPVFGGAPPTLGKGGWQLDQAWMGRIGRGRGDDEQMLRTMLSVGITEDLQISASLPITLNSGVYMPRGRTMAMMARRRIWRRSPDGGSSGAQSGLARGSNPRRLSVSRRRCSSIAQMA